MLQRNSSKNIAKEPPSYQSKPLIVNFNSTHNRIFSHRIRPIQLNSPRKPPVIAKMNDFYTYQKAVVSSLPKPSQRVNNPNPVMKNTSVQYNQSMSMRKTFNFHKNNS